MARMRRVGRASGCLYLLEERTCSSGSSRAEETRSGHNLLARNEAAGGVPAKQSRGFNAVPLQVAKRQGSSTAMVWSSGRHTTSKPCFSARPIVASVPLLNSR